MKRLFWVLFAMLVIIASTAVAEEKIKIISGYGIGEFTAKGIILDQVKILTAMIKAEQPDSTYTISILVVGSADSVGTSAENDRLSKDRAESVAAELESSFPGIKPIVAPHGNAANKRQVIVEYTFFKPVPDKNLVEINSKLDSLSAAKKEKNNKEILLGLAIAAFSFIGIVLVGLSLIRGFRKKPATPAEIVSVPEEVPWNEEKIWRDITTKSSGVYRVEILRKTRVARGEEELFVSPFISEQKQEITEKKERLIKSSIKRCLESPDFKEQLDALVKNGKITKL